MHIYHDRLAIITPGGLPAGMKKEDLGHKSVPRNPLLFSMFYRMSLVEQIGSGIKRISDLCREDGVAEPDFEVSEYWFTVAFKRVVAPIQPENTEQVTPQVEKLISALKGDMRRDELFAAVGLKHRMHFISEALLEEKDVAPEKREDWKEVG
ncbi:MAG: ATP-binding protein [Pseudomonadota bacterium]